MGVASGCGEQEVGVASRSGWNLWVWLLGVVVRRYIDFLILLSLLLLYLFFFAAASLLFVHLKNVFRSLILWLPSLSGVIRSLLCNPSAFGPGIIIISVCANMPT